MKTISKLLLLVMLLAAPGAFLAAQEPEKKPAAPAAEYKYKTPKLNRAKFDELLAKPENLLLIDVRRPDELTNIGGFPVYLSIQASEVEKSLGYIPKDRKIVTVSNHAGRAGAAADLLAQKGFKVVGAVGAENYAEEGGQLTKIAPPPKN